jgi:hypothetical protein
MQNSNQSIPSSSMQSLFPIAGTALALVALLSVGLITVGGIAMSMVM